MILESEISKSLDCFWKTIDWIVNDPIYLFMHFLRLQIDLWAEICLHGREAVSILLPIVCKKCETYLLNCQQRLSQHPMPTWRNTNDSQFSTVCSPTIVSSPPSIDVGHDIVRSRLTAIARGHSCTRLRSAIGRCPGQGRLRALYPFWCAVYKSTLEKEPHFHCGYPLDLHLISPVQQLTVNRI